MDRLGAEKVPQMALTWQDIRRRISRRRFLQLLSGLGITALLRSVSARAMEKQPASRAIQPPGPTPTPTAVPPPTQTPAPSATPIADTQIFSEAGLSPVFVAHAPSVSGYPAKPPYDPTEIYPEYPHPASSTMPDNAAYGLVREALGLMAPEGFGSTAWNPLGRLIRPGDTVLIKPNLVDDSAWEGGQITHPAFLRPVIDYACLACGPTGRVLLAEGPWAPGVFDRVVVNTGIQAMVEHLAVSYGAPVGMLDLNKGGSGEARWVDLGHLSELSGENRIWNDAHGQPLPVEGERAVGRYLIALPVLQADVVISVPKIKVHCSGGITVTMKNMLGIVPCWDGSYEDASLKDCAHISDVDLAQGKRGEYLDNDTIWRSIADLNRILLYADDQGVIHPERQRRYLSIVDGIVAGTTSQYNPVPYPLSAVIVGYDPVPVDAVSARIMGFDPRKFKSVARAALRDDLPLGPDHPAGIKVVLGGGNTLSNAFRQSLTPEVQVYNWQGHVEASDFDAPSLESWTWEEGSGKLQATVVDPAGVAWVRLAYQFEGERRLKALSLVAGDPTRGVWEVAFPIGAAVKSALLLCSDELFNESSQTIGW